MKKLSLLIILFTLQSCLIGSGENSEIAANNVNYFPKIVGINLEGKEQKLPDSFTNKLNIVIVAFKREQQSEVDSWIKATESILQENSNVNFYEVPLIYELSAFKRLWVNNGMRFGITNKIARKRTITVYTDREKFFEITKMNRDKIYALLIGDSGEILWKDEGVADKDNIQSLRKSILDNFS